MDRAGIVGADGPTHHGLLDIAYLRGYPNIVLMAPKDEAELRDMMLTAIDFPGPAAKRYPRGNGVGIDISAKPKPIEIGKAEIVREGRDVAIVAYGSMVYPAIEAAELLKNDGVEATVVNARFVKPLDTETFLRIARDFDLIVTAEEAYLAGGFGSAVLELLEANDLQDRVKLVRMGVADEIVTHGDPKDLLAGYGLNAKGIYERVKKTLESSVETTATKNKLRAVK
jgi:1-deoxy-D-xylulose-5-phosphate synthase